MKFTLYKLSMKVLTYCFYWFSPLRKPFFLISLCLLFVVLCAFRSSVQPLVLTLVDNGKMVTVSPGYQVSIQLPENAGSTGYAWSEKTSESQILTLQSTRYVSPHGSSRPGASGTVVFTFVAQKNGNVVLHFELRRPWETNVPPAQRFEVIIQVQPW
jgi:inhibitor of cysteine peptidase